MNVAVPLQVTPNDGLAGLRAGDNPTHTTLASYADAGQPDNVLVAWLGEQKKKVPTPVLLARFGTADAVTSERLEALLDLGFDSWVIGRPPASLIEKICAKITKDVSLVSVRYGSLGFQGGIFCRNNKEIKFSPKEAKIFQVLLGAGGTLVPVSRLNSVIGFNPGTKTHTVQTHISRLRNKLSSLGIEGVIHCKPQEGYQLLFE